MYTSALVQFNAAVYMAGAGTLFLELSWSLKGTRVKAQGYPCHAHQYTIFEPRKIALSLEGTLLVS